MPKGLTLIEVVIGIALVSVLIVAFGVSLLAAVYAQRIKIRNMAAALADEGLAAIHAGATSGLANQTDGPLVGLLFNQGTWGAGVDATAPSASNAMKASTVSATGVTSLLQLPKNAYGDFTLTAKFKVLGGAPADWRAGLLFRAADLRNHYHVYLTSSALALKKVVNGTESTLYSDARVVATDAWQTLTVTTAGSSITVVLNGDTITTQSDPSFTTGRAALAVWEGAAANFDDVTVESATWDFDATAAGTMPDDWRRFGLTDLPSGAATLTVSTPYADTSLRRYTLTVTWIDKRGGSATLSQSTLKAN